ncbi:MAG: hypothetical protein KatS3mg068_0346 [Candidatus Sericytochromatia bacterium]|nr:MAG: hypothetical protein KatS3mg068_0346 [Candidatus Sericytochromatia bacterium]
MYKRREKRKPLKLEKSEKADFVSSYVYSIKNFFPDLNNWISELKDFRQKKKCTYKIKEIIILSLILLSFIGSRRNYNIELNKIEAKEFLNKAFKLNLISIPNGDTLAYFWNNFDKSELVGEI